MRFFRSKESSAQSEKSAAETTEQAEERQATQLESQEEEADDTEYPSLKVVLTSWIALNLGFFLVALDRTIIGVAIPHISNEFKSFGQIGWYESAFFLTTCVLNLPMGKVYSFYSPKWVYLTVIAIFELGSLICAAAPNSTAFIIGRAIAGIGGAGTFAGVSTILISLVPLQKRPTYQGFLGALFGLASIAGPLLGGVFTSKLTWRWCFWINLPIGGVAFLALVIFLPATPPKKKYSGSFLGKLGQLDPIGFVILCPGIICLLLAVQWGGTTYPWGDARIIALLVLAGVLLTLFTISQLWGKEKATIPPRIIRQRSVAAGFVSYLGLGSVLVIVAFYLPIWFQAIQGDTPVHAGIKLLPYFLGTVVFVISSGIGVSLLGYYTPFLIIGSAILMVGIGLLTTFDVNTSEGKWLGYQIVVGAGTGLSLQQSINAVNTVLKPEDIPVGVAVLGFAQSFGGSIFVTVCQTVLTNTLKSSLEGKIPGFDPSSVTQAGATNIRNLVPVKYLPVFLDAYNEALVNVFYTGLGLSALVFITSWFLEWKTVKKPT